MQDTTIEPRTRRERAAVFGLGIGLLLGAAFVLTSDRAVAERQAELGGPLLDATHVPPLLTTTGEDVVLRYDIHCSATADEAEDAACKPGGTVFIRAGESGPFRRLPLSLDEHASEERHQVRVPTAIARSRRGFSYHAVIDAGDGETTLTLPPGGAEAPHRSLPLGRAAEISLDTHDFGQVQRADDRVVRARWGRGSAEVGLEGGTNMPPVGGSSFDVDGNGDVIVLDQVNRRVLRWTPGSPAPNSVAVPVDGTIADLSIAPDGTMYVLESSRAGRAPALRTLDRSGRELGVAELSERTATQVQIGPSGPLVLQQPSGQWVPLSRAGGPLSAAANDGAGLSGRPLPGGDEVVVLRTGNELRLALTRGGVVRQSWRVTSATPLAEVQVAEPFGEGLLVVVRVYTETDDAFVALRLGPHGLLGRVSLDSADWAESAPLGRFRLAGSSLYQLGATRAGIFVDRFDLEVR